MNLAIRQLLNLAWPLIAGLTCAGCGGNANDDDPVMARAYDRQLRWSDLRQLVPLGSAAEDSAAMVEAYVHAWLRQQVELHHAELNLAEGRKQFESELREYRNSLLLHAYEEELVSQRLDTVITEADLEAYYTEQRDQFDLKDDLLRVRWFRVAETDKKVLRKIEDRFMSGDADRMREVEIELARRGSSIIDRSGTWTSAAELRNEVPFEDLPVVPAGGRRTVVKDEQGAWFLDILELRPRLSPSPIELVRQEIRSILLNQRKLLLIERMRDDLYRDAVAHHEIEAL